MSSVMRVLTLSLLFVSSAALYADQAGLHDRVRRHIGPPIQAVGGGRSAVVATSAGAIASITLASGDIMWRIVAEDGA